MAINKKRLTVTEFDFDDVKNNLKIFLKGQTEFKDYDFEGSGMSALLDVLAYNTHYLGFNANMLANEMFLDSASLRSSVVSHAKTLGYVPNSARASVATVDVNLNTTSLASATMSAGTVFTTTVDDVDYQFVTASDKTASSIGNIIPFLSVEIYEGTFISTRYTVDTSDVDQRFLLTDNRADKTTLTVKVQNSSSDSTTATYTEATDITQVTATSEVYFIQEVETGKFEVYFGDGVVGNALEDGNIVIFTYVVSNKAAANGASVFTNASTIATVSDVAVSTVSNASSGSEAESIASIKYNAPLDYASQGRCVTSEDYKVFTKRYFSNTQAVQVFGGESGSYDSSLGVVSTPEYGKVFISIKSTTGLDLTTSEKTKLVRDLAPFTVASTTPVIVDPAITYLILNTKFKYDSSATTKTSDSLETLVTSTLQNYNDNSLEQFEGMYRHSKVTGLVDNVDTSITSNITTVKMAKKFIPTLNASTSYTINFDNAFYNPKRHREELTYAVAPTLTIGTITGTFTIGEVITGATSGATGRIMNITSPFSYISTNSLSFTVGEVITGESSTATTTVTATNLGGDEEHSKTRMGTITSTGFKISGDATNEMFFDDDGTGILRIYYLSAGERIYQDQTAGTVDYDNGTIAISGVNITTVSDVDGIDSTQIRVIAIPNSYDVIPKRNQILEIDFVNLIVTGEVDTVAIGDSTAGTSYSAAPSQVPFG
ncbi:MAG: hypothetical protein QGH83_13095 [Candidatus Pacebacteria bacterium]|nr:hypothetical protein [Candidatus Paceibacterota bacterium]